MNHLLTPLSGIRDNHTRGTAGGFLKERIGAGSLLSVVSAYFTIYAYEALATELNQIDRLRFLFGEPGSIQTVDTQKKSIPGRCPGLKLARPFGA